MGKSPKSIGLPLPKTLQTNKLEDIQNHLRLINEALDTKDKLLLFTQQVLVAMWPIDFAAGTWIGNMPTGFGADG